MSRGNFPPKAVASGSKCRFELHLFFASPERGRYSADGTGVPQAVWKKMDSFEICEGEPGGLVFMYNSKHRTQRDSRQLLNEWEYTEFLASGVIDVRQSELRFDEPADPEGCKAYLRDAVSDPQFLRYFGQFRAFGPAGEEFGQTNTFCVRDHDDN